MRTKFLSRSARKNTANGNMTWDVTTSDGVFRTKPDAHVGLECQNWRTGDEIEIHVVSGTITEGEKA